MKHVFIDGQWLVRDQQLGRRSAEEQVVQEKDRIPDIDPAVVVRIGVDVGEDGPALRLAFEGAVSDSELREVSTLGDVVAAIESRLKADGRLADGGKGAG